MSHETFQRVIFLQETSATTTLEDLRRRAQKDLETADVSLEFSRDIIHTLVCKQCGSQEELFAPVGTISYARGRCPVDDTIREVVTVHNYQGNETFGDKPLEHIGLPPFDILTARSKDREVHYLLAGDADRVLGKLADSFMLNKSDSA
jgi:hypothetical protein